MRFNFRQFAAVNIPYVHVFRISSFTSTDILNLPFCVDFEIEIAGYPVKLQIIIKELRFFSINSQ